MDAMKAGLQHITNIFHHDKTTKGAGEAGPSQSIQKEVTDAKGEPSETAKIMVTLALYTMAAGMPHPRLAEEKKE